MTTICEKLSDIRKQLPATVKLVAVSKFHPVECILEAYRCGQRIFGESRVQELAAKQPVLPDDIVWHFIGPLQSNKVKYIAPFVRMIESVDSLKLLEEIDKQAAKHNRVIDVLIEIHVAREENKHGFTPGECLELPFGELKGKYPHVRICGLMGMATFTDDQEQIRKEFRTLRQLFDTLKASRFNGEDSFSELSMGMTDDYPAALEEGSTMVRIGSYIFGAREY